MLSWRISPLVAVVLVACTPPTGGTSDGDSEGASTGATSTGTSSTDVTAGQSSGQSTADEPGIHFTADVWPILTATCSCHFPSVDMTPGQATILQLDIDPAVSYTRLVDQPSSVAGLDYVEPGDPDASYVVHKLDGTYAAVGGVGTEMPPGAPLASPEQDLIKNWIAGGALE